MYSFSTKSFAYRFVNSAYYEYPLDPNDLLSKMGNVLHSNSKKKIDLCADISIRFYTELKQSTMRFSLSKKQFCSRGTNELETQTI